MRPPIAGQPNTEKRDNIFFYILVSVAIVGALAMFGAIIIHPN